MDDEKGGVVTRILGWVRKPFSSDMDALHWFMFFGLVLVIFFLWSRIMAMITE